MKQLIEDRQLLMEGYTHYWKHGGFDDAAWAKVVKEAKSIVKKAKKDGIEIAGGSGKGKPEFTKKAITLNGKDPDDYETFYLSKAAQDFEFTKTAQKPYDPVVVSILAVAKKANKGFEPSSDGGDAAIKRVY